MWFAQLGMLVAIPITIKFFLPIYSKLDIDTAYHYLEIRFGSNIRAGAEYREIICRVLTRRAVTQSLDICDDIKHEH